MFKLRHLVETTFPSGEIHDDMEETMNLVRKEWQSKQKHQSWRLVPKRLLDLVWLSCVKYGRVNERGLEKIWEIIKENALKIILNSEIRHGLWDEDFFGVEEGDEVPEKILDRWYLFTSDRSSSTGFSRSDADAALAHGYSRYSDQHNHLFKYLEKGYKASTPEEKLLAIDQILNFIHGIGYMSKWFVEGGVDSLIDLRDKDVKGIRLAGRLTESKYPAIKTKSGKVYIGRIHADAVSKTEEDLESVGWWEDSQYYTEDEARKKWGKASTDDLEPELHRAFRLNRQVPEIPDYPVNKLKEEKAAGKTFIIVDVQPEYEKFVPWISKIVSYLNRYNEEINRIVFLYNGSDTLGMIKEDDYKIWWMENGLEESVIDSSYFYDKGYAFFRYCMDSGDLDEQTISNFVRFMYENNVRDSRDMTRDMWAKYLREYRKTDRKGAFELLHKSEDCVNIPDLMDYLREFNNIVICGGGVTECLKEVEIALQALKKSYDTDHRFTY